MYSKFNEVTVWPTREQVNTTMLASFGKYPTTCCCRWNRSLLIEQSSSLVAPQRTFSSYKKHDTQKVLIGIIPSGTIRFVSKLYGGSISDCELIKSDLLEILEFGDCVLVDKSFTITVSLNIPNLHYSTPHRGPSPQIDKIIFLLASCRNFFFWQHLPRFPYCVMIQLFSQVVYFHLGFHVAIDAHLLKVMESGIITWYSTSARSRSTRSKSTKTRRLVAVLSSPLFFHDPYLNLQHHTKTHGWQRLPSNTISKVHVWQSKWLPTLCITNSNGPAQLTLMYK